ncbi:hypothetical protein P7K49_028093 [Saguinus oedipus]|uniref:Uncharacterized protein n=1 Tax=Saguinus oedipus TaxID=9490 RepID=A0ABQ9UBE8_SAGOE|nr:hypothetical protein P7K49_028093 [Saguinus oedipus]
MVAPGARHRPDTFDLLVGPLGGAGARKPVVPGCGRPLGPWKFRLSPITPGLATLGRGFRPVQTPYLG